MPVVSASITNREWDAVEQEYNIKPKTTRQLAMEGHWLLEGIDAEGYDVVVHKVPAPLRFLLLHGFGRAYRRRADARWTPDASPVGRRGGDGRASRGSETALQVVAARQQAAETRALVLAAATSLFAEGGWAATGMRDIAREAGVSVETVYASFGSKTELLMRAIDVGVVGDTEPVPLSQRPEFAALGSGSVTDRIDAAARMLTGINRRTWGLRRALHEAAGSEPQLAARLHELERRRRDNIRQGVEMVVGRPVEDDVLDGLWVVMGADVFCLLTQVGGRPADDYERWLATTIRRLLSLDDA